MLNPTDRASSNVTLSQTRFVSFSPAQVVTITMIYLNNFAHIFEIRHVHFIEAEFQVEHGPKIGYCNNGVRAHVDIIHCYLIDAFNFVKANDHDNCNYDKRDGGPIKDRTQYVSLSLANHSHNEPQ